MINSLEEETPISTEGLQPSGVANTDLEAYNKVSASNSSLTTNLIHEQVAKDLVKAIESYEGANFDISRDQTFDFSADCSAMKRKHWT